uniref:Uncharacterized protein n=1 Tax=Pseudomonas phage RVTF4 TaxID=3236931 RepID=A0AB39CCB1_9VIRU
MNLTQACMLISFLSLIWAWGDTWAQRVKVTDMAWMYKPSVHGDDYKAKCLELFRDYKVKFWMSTAVSLIYIGFAWYYFDKGAL